MVLRLASESGGCLVVAVVERASLSVVVELVVVVRASVVCPGKRVVLQTSIKSRSSRVSLRERYFTM
eukprot:1718460-Pleurochrysis_carterae.AAC.1